jgi:flavin-dependent dehydrogenase
VEAYDVVIVGSGIAGGFLARQLRLARPSLSVLVLEASEKMVDYKVGESTVEVAAHYMVRRLELGTYLYQHQLPKNGLRFFFDTEQKDLPLTRMSEIGADHFPFHPSFQLERAALERDLVDMNRASGVRVELGAKVVDVAIDAAAGHTVTWEQGGERRTTRARWVVDASGRRQLLARKLGLKITKETRLNTGAAWGRYRNVAGLDAIRDEAWRARVRHTSRHLSTNHMMYDGYWIWFIPLAGDLMSVGVVFDKDRIGQGPRTREEFEQFLDGHRACRDLMQGAVFEDFQGYAHLAYYPDQFFSADRWALVGEAGAFLDPFYSPGSDFITTANEFVTSMILSDADGDAAALAEKTETYNAYYRFKYETTLRLYAKLYPVFGCFEVFRLKYLLDFNNYYNLVVWPFMADKLTDVAWLRDELKTADVVLRTQSTMADHFVKMADKLRAEGRYFAQNEGEWANGLNGVDQFETRLGPVLDAQFRKEQVGRAFGSVYASLLERILGEEGLGKRTAVLNELDLPMVLALRDADEHAFGRLVSRAAGRIERTLRAELPDAGVERVVFERDGGATRPARVVGKCAGSPDEARALARARELWDHETESLTHVRL